MQEMQGMWVPWTEEPGGLQSMGLQRIGQTKHARVHARTHTHTHTLSLSQSLSLSHTAFQGNRLSF